MRLLVVEDNPKLSALLLKLLTERGYVSDAVATAMDAAAVRRCSYDLVVLDLSLPDGDGRALLRAMRRSENAVPVLVATARSELLQCIETLDEGADDYLIKPFSPEELLARVRALLRRPRGSADTLLTIGNVVLDTMRLTVVVGGEPVKMTRREVSVLAALLRARGRLVPRRALEDGGSGVSVRRRSDAECPGGGNLPRAAPAGAARQRSFADDDAWPRLHPGIPAVTPARAGAQEPPRLLTLLIVRTLLVAAGSVALLLRFFVIRYLDNPEELSQHTLERQAVAVGTALADGQDPAGWPLYVGYPHAYAFRVLDAGRPAGQWVLAEANAGLLPPLRSERNEAGQTVLRLRERFEALPLPGGSSSGYRWMLTDWQAVQNRGIWVQVGMIGAPAWTLRAALADEIVAHVVVPSGVLVPTITLAILMVMRSALRPLQDVAQETRGLGRIAARGASLSRLSEEGLTRELRDMVQAVNAMLMRLDEVLLRERAFAAEAAHE